MDFSLKMERIEKILNQLEKSALPLEETLALYEEGENLIKECREYLEQAEQKVIILSENEEEKIFRTFEE